MSYPVYLGRAPGPRGSWQGTSQCRDAQPYPNNGNGPNFQRRRKLKMWGWFGMYIGHVRAHLFSSQLLMGSKLLGIHDCLILLLADYFDMCWKCCIGGILRGWNSMESRWSCVPWLLPSWTMPYCNCDIITQPQQCIVVWFCVCVVQRGRIKGLLEKLSMHSDEPWMHRYFCWYPSFLSRPGARTPVITQLRRNWPVLLQEDLTKGCVR